MSWVSTKNALRVLVLVGHLRTGLKPAFRHVLVVLGLASPLLLAVALGQFGRIDALSRTTKFSKLEQFGDTVALGCALGGNNKKRAENGKRRRAPKTYGSSASSSLFACCCASESERSGEGSRMRGWGLVRFLIIELRSESRSSARPRTSTRKTVRPGRQQSALVSA